MKLGFAIYLGIGAMLHAMFAGPQFDWTSAWTFGWLLGWPIMVTITSYAIILGAAAICGACIVIWEWLKMIAHWREGRRSRP